jgi:hypothetical protein
MAERQQLVTKAEVERVMVEIAVENLLRLIRDLTDPDDPCRFDHHGHCQAHGWTDIDPACPHARARRILARWRDSEAGRG